jgi:hypothetical protein
MAFFRMQEGGHKVRTCIVVQWIGQVCRMFRLC